MKSNVLSVAVALLIMSSCRKFDKLNNTGPDNGNGTIQQMTVSPSFFFQTAKEIAVSLTTIDNVDQPVGGVRINIYADFPENGGSQIASFRTDASGTYTDNIKIPAYLDSLVLETSAIGYVSMQKRPIASGNLNVVFGGSNPLRYGKAVIPDFVQPLQSAAWNNEVLSGAFSPSGPSANPVIKAIGAFNTLGVPSYLISPNDIVDAAFLTDINNALPEYKPVPTAHPAYLNANNETNLEFQKISDVWVTFVHEGAGYRNVLCYYKYNSATPPTSVSQIDTLYAIFPNTSFVNSGGGLVSGNKVKIGTFAPGTTIGWAIIANGYNGTAITSGAGIYYSNAALNPETNVNLKKHCILLNDVNRGKFLLSFEDLNRAAGADNDFNDAIFYVTSNPVEGFKIANVPLPAYTVLDADGDGVTDNFDDFPNDPSKAFNNYYPSATSVGTLAFEDNWPYKGDYDFNDMVIDYQYNVISNAQNQVVQIKAMITPKAIGASFHSGFGFQLPVASNQVASVSGSDLRHSLVTRNANGTEANQSKATIIVFDDAFDQLPWPGSGIGVNTTPGAPYVTPKTLTITIDLVSPVSANSLGLPPYNAFIFTNRIRGNEVHLVNEPPTDLANRSLLGTGDDKSTVITGRYYLTAQNLPFAIDVAGPYEYTIEKAPITQGHLKFYNWGNSSGISSRDWYLNGTNKRDASKIFQH